MFDKKYIINELYLAKIGTAELVCVKEGIFEKKFYPKTYTCVKKIKDEKGIVFYQDALNNLKYNNFNEATRGENLLDVKTLKSFRELFKNPNFKVLNKKIINALIEEFNKAPQERNAKEYVQEACKLNKIKIVKKEKQETNDNTL